ncbi:solute carrier family 23 member 3 isoform X5 [Sylvia atricapilla]|uniref:solute carrier family 23 member 3 isoform X5 n=1 Tax=Sylvia atricapilla TaxID=48155 RepID=UPI003391A30B
MRGSKGSCLLALLVMVYSSLLTPECTCNVSGHFPRARDAGGCWRIFLFCSQQPPYCILLDAAPGPQDPRVSGPSKIPFQAQPWPVHALYLIAETQGAGLTHCKRLMLLAVTFSQHLRSCHLPFCAWPRAWEGSTDDSVPTLRTFSVLLSFAGVCIVCAILSYFHIPWESLDVTMAQLSWANSTLNAPWIHMPYAGEWRWPLLTPRALAVGIAMAISCSMNSVGCYVLCRRLLRVPRLPPHACNRGLCMEGLGSLLAGLLGSPGGTASSIANTCATGLTQAGSRLSVQVSALVCMVLGMSPRLAGLLTHIPLAVHGGVLCVTYAVAVGTGISYFQYTDIDSGRNIFIVGFAMFMALLVPRWFSTALAPLVTGWVPLDLLFLSVLMAPVFLTGFLSFFLENTVSGTLEERGLLSEQPWKARASDCHLHGERGEASQAYRLPTRLRRLLPSSCKAFLCCFLCPRSEEEEEGSCAIEEGTAAPGEGTHLLPKLSSGELQPAIRPSQTDMPAWHTVA